MNGLPGATRHFQCALLSFQDFLLGPGVFTGSIEPADRGVIVMCAGVSDTVLLDILDIELRVAHFELKHDHAGNLTILPQEVDFGRDHAQVFRHDRQAPQ